MRKTIWAGMFAAAAFTVGSEARADANLHSADVLRPGDNMIYGEVGWPDFTFGFQHGVSNSVDVGFKFSLPYGYEYTTGVLVGMGLSVPIRITPVRTGKFSFQFQIDPGLKFDAFSPLYFGLWLPLGLDFGIHITREATLSFGMTMPVYINFTNGVYGAIPILFGPGFEYDIDDHIAVGANLKFGPSIRAECVGQDAMGNCVEQSGAAFGFITQFFFAYRL